MSTYPLDPEQYKLTFSREVGAFLDAYRRADPSEVVPSCPDWAVSDLGAHIASIYHRIAELLRIGSLEALDPRNFPAPEDPRDVLDYFLEGANRVSDQFGVLDPDQPIWTFLGVVPAVFWMRRMTHETMVHAFDIENLHPPLHEPLPVAIADGIDEFFTVQLARKLTGQPVSKLHGRLGIHVAGGDRWVINLFEGGLEMLDTNDPSEAELTGSAYDLLMFLWRRGDSSALACEGDTQLIATYRDHVRL